MSCAFQSTKFFHFNSLLAQGMLGAATAFALWVYLRDSFRENLWPYIKIGIKMATWGHMLYVSNKSWAEDLRGLHSLFPSSNAHFQDLLD